MKGTIKNSNLCYHCSLTLDAADSGPAETDAVWYDTDGRTDGKIVKVCQSCLDAGDSEGPGYAVAK